MNLESLRVLYIHELSELYDTEHQLLKALPKMAYAACCGDLRMDFEKHLALTQVHMSRLERAFSSLDEKPTRTTCKGMKGILDDTGEMINAEGDPAIKDAGLISAAQRVEHYAMARYGCARTYAEMLIEEEAAELLQKTLNDQRAMDESLTEQAECLIHAEEPLWT